MKGSEINYKEEWTTIVLDVMTSENKERDYLMLLSRTNANDTDFHNDDEIGRNQDGSPTEEWYGVAVRTYEMLEDSPEQRKESVDFANSRTRWGF
jgi:hypothetical protein